MKTLLVVVVIIAGLTGGGIWYWNSRGTDAPDYKTFKVNRADLIQTVTATGQINPVTNVSVGSQVSGIVSKLYADYNSPVTHGQLIAEIDPATYAAVVAQGRADLENAEAQRDLARANLDRAEALDQKGLLAKADFDQSKATYAQAKAMVSIKTASLDQSLANLAYTKIYAPIDGMVLSRNVDVGQTVAASFSAPTLFIIANDIAKMQIDALVSEADIGSIQTNQLVNFSVDAYPGQPFRGAVKQIRNLPQTNQNVVNYDSLIAVDNGLLLLRPGMTANVSIITDQRTNALRIPNTALRYRPPDAAEAASPSAGGAPQVARGNPGDAGGPRRGEGGLRRGEGGPGSGRSGNPGGGGRGRGGHPLRTIYVLADSSTGGGKVPKPVQIHTGIGDGVFTEVIDGLNEGDEVITSQSSTSGATVATGQPQPANPFGGGGRRF